MSAQHLPRPCLGVSGNGVNWFRGVGLDEEIQETGRLFLRDGALGGRREAMTSHSTVLFFGWI